MSSISDVLYTSEISSLVQFVRGATACAASSNTERLPLGGVICWVLGSTGASITVLNGRTGNRAAISLRPKGLESARVAISNMDKL